MNSTPDMVLEVLGTPPAEDINSLQHDPARQYVCSLGQHAGTPWEHLLPQCTPEGTKRRHIITCVNNSSC